MDDLVRAGKVLYVGILRQRPAWQVSPGLQAIADLRGWSPLGPRLEIEYSLIRAHRRARPDPDGE